MADSYTFPEDLTKTQEELRQVTADLSAVYARLPWSTEKHPGFTEEESRWRRWSRPATDGWSPEDHQEVERLRERQLQLTIQISTHPVWERWDGPARVTARMALKHWHETGPAAVK